MFRVLTRAGLGKRKKRIKGEGQRKVFAAITFKNGNFLFADGDRLNLSDPSN